MTDRKTTTSIGEQGDGDAIPLLLQSLNRVEAPGDFDLRVRARIAQGRPSALSSGWFRPLLQVGLPAVMVLAVGSYIATNSIFVGDIGSQTADTQIRTVETAELPVQPPIDRPNGVTITRSSVTDPGNDPSIEVAKEPAKVSLPVKAVQTAVKKKPTTVHREIEIPESPSFDQAVREVQVLTIPDALPEDEPTPEPEKAAVSRDPFEIVRRAGATLTRSGEIWRVNSVAAGSVAQRAGLMSGDTIENISVESGKARLLVERNGTKLSIDIKP